MPGVQNNNQEPTVHSHGCNCFEITEDWLTDWSDPEVPPPPLEDADENMWEEVILCNNLRKLLMKKREYESNESYFNDFTQHIYPFAVKKLKTNLAQEIVKALTLPKGEGERTKEFEMKVNSLSNKDGDCFLQYYHENNHWSPDCYVCQKQHDTLSTKNMCDCTICGLKS